MTCLKCKKEKLNKNRNFYCSKHCARLGRKLSEKTKEKISTAKKTNPTRYWLGKKRPSMDWLLREGRIPWNKGKKREEMQNEKHWNWKGGITPLTKIIRKCFEYRQWRSDVFTRDNFTCVLCGKRGGWLEADHYPKMFSTIFQENKIISYEQAIVCEEFWNINNGRTLCRECHNLNKKRLKN